MHGAISPAIIFSAYTEACTVQLKDRGNYSISGIQNLIQQITVQGEKGGWSGVPVEKSKSSSA